MTMHHPDSLITHLRRDLGALTCRAVAPGHALFSSADSALELDVREKVEAHFLMRVVSAEFRLHVAAPPQSAHLRIRHTGLWRRTGIHCDALLDDATTRALAMHLNADAALRECLLPLDFVACDIQGVAEGWQCRLTHYGASEVVHRIPATRHYIRLADAQVDLLLRAFTRLSLLLGTAPFAGGLQ